AQCAPRPAPTQLGLSLERSLRPGLPRAALLTAARAPLANSASTPAAIPARRSRGQNRALPVQATADRHQNHRDPSVPRLKPTGKAHHTLPYSMESVLVRFAG